MKKYFILSLAVCMLVLAGCADSFGESTDHTHNLSDGGNVLEHEEAGYCGNTVTKVKYAPMGADEDEKWEMSFWGSESVAITDLLIYLDYSEETCKCMPEYTIDTEFGDGYGVSLAEGYARYKGKQVSLTSEQVAEIKNAIESAQSHSEMQKIIVD